MGESTHSSASLGFDRRCFLCPAIGEGCHLENLYVAIIANILIASSAKRSSYLGLDAGDDKGGGAIEERPFRVRLREMGPREVGFMFREDARGDGAGDVPA